MLNLPHVWGRKCRQGIVEEEVTLGCHQGALMVFGLEAPHIDLPSAMCFLRIRRWLMECGTPLDHRHLECTVSSVSWKWWGWLGFFPKKTWGNWVLAFVFPSSEV